MKKADVPSTPVPLPQVQVPIPNTAPIAPSPANPTSTRGRGRNKATSTSPPKEISSVVRGKKSGGGNRKRKDIEDDEEDSDEDFQYMVQNSEDQLLAFDDNGNESTKKIHRLLKNREAAQLFRERQKEYINELEKQVNALTTENTDAKSKVELLMSENKIIKEQLQYLRNFIAQALSFSFQMPPNLNHSPMGQALGQLFDQTPTQISQTADQLENQPLQQMMNQQFFQLLNQMATNNQSMPSDSSGINNGNLQQAQFNQLMNQPIGQLLTQLYAQSSQSGQSINQSTANSTMQSTATPNSTQTSNMDTTNSAVGTQRNSNQ